jgi:hypothetical protein
MDIVETAALRLRWLRAFVAGLLAEVALVIVAVPVFMTMSQPTSLLNLLIPPASFVAFLAAGWWSAKPVPAVGTLQGALAGIIAIALYVLLAIAALLFEPGAKLSDSLTVPYMIAHALKVVGAALGGWLVARKAA